MRRESVVGRYYLKPFIAKLKARGWKQGDIAELFDCSISTLKYVTSWDGKPNDGSMVEQLFGSRDDEFLRVVAEIRCTEFLVSHGWQVGKADAKCVFDIFGIKGDATIKMQVKSTSCLSGRGWPIFDIGRLKFNTTECKRLSFKPGDFDYWFFYHKNGDAWVIPFDKITNSSTISMEGFDEYHIDD